MPKRYPRPASEIAQYAADLAGRWNRGDGIEPWLREVEPELTRKVRNERWTWESIARAFNEAGIQYETGRPWTGKSLGVKVAAVRHEQAIRAARQPRPAHEPMPAARPSPPLAASPVSPHDQVRPAPDQEPGDSAPVALFEPVRFKKPPPPRKAAVPPPPQPAEPKLDPEEAIARMFGRSVPAKGGS